MAKRKTGKTTQPTARQKRDVQDARLLYLKHIRLIRVEVALDVTSCPVCDIGFAVPAGSRSIQCPNGCNVYGITMVGDPSGGKPAYVAWDPDQIAAAARDWRKQFKKVAKPAGKAVAHA